MYRVHINCPFYDLMCFTFYDRHRRCLLWLISLPFIYIYIYIYMTRILYKLLTMTCIVAFCDLHDCVIWRSEGQILRHATAISMSQLDSKFKFSHPLAVICGSMGVSLYDFVSLPSMTCIFVFYDIVLSTKYMSCYCLPWPAIYGLYSCLIWHHIASTYIFLGQFDSNSKYKNLKSYWM